MRNIAVKTAFLDANDVRLIGSHLTALSNANDILIV